MIRTLALLAAMCLTLAEARTPKLIISIIVDDLGAHDLGHTNGDQIRTPAFSRLRAEGLALSRLYVQPICTPTRSSFLTSRLALALGMQGKQTIQQGCPWGLDLGEQTFVEALQGAGWRTAMVGKAHIGGDYWRRTPTYRGFDSFIGYYYGAEDYYTHTLGNFYDLRNDTAPRCGPGCSRAIGSAHNGTYSPYLFAAEVIRHIAAAAASPQPTFIYFAPQSVHAPKEAPQEFVQPYVAQFGPQNPWRAVHAGALACLDAALANITAAIAAAGLAEDALIFVNADNGGPLGDTGDGTMASNYPLRGGKHSLYEGGVRAVGLVWGPGILGPSPPNATWEGLAHITDLGPTLLEAAGVAPLPPHPGRPVHGQSFWQALLARQPPRRGSVVVNVDYTTPMPQAALVRADGMKLIVGGAGDDTCNYWSDPVGLPETPPPGQVGGGGHSKAPSAHSVLGSGLLQLAPPPFWPLADMTLTLYNLTEDPRETRNLTQALPDVAAELLAELAVWGSTAAVPVAENPTPDPASNPGRYWNGSWTPWRGV